MVWVPWDPIWYRSSFHHLSEYAGLIKQQEEEWTQIKTFTEPHTRMCFICWHKLPKSSTTQANISKYRPGHCTRKTKTKQKNKQLRTFAFLGMYMVIKETRETGKEDAWVISEANPSTHADVIQWICMSCQKHLSINSVPAAFHRSCPPVGFQHLLELLWP